MVTISETAGQELKKVLQGEQAKGKGLFVNFMGYGWSGPSLGLALDEPEDGVKSFNSQGIDVFMHPSLVDQLEQFGGVLIDFIDNGPEQRGFTISTKNKPEGLDCGSCGTAEGGCGTDKE